MPVPYMLNSRISIVFLISLIFFSHFPGFILSAILSLSSIEIYRTHEWLKVVPTVSFRCKGENKTVLPDVKEANIIYTFKGQESWQPLTNFSSVKCKRCGFYEQDNIISDIVYDEWEFCPSEFTKPYGAYLRFKEKEFNATFLCPECLSFDSDDNSAFDWHVGKKEMHIAVLVVLIALGSTILILMVVSIFKYWQKEKRQKEQAKFLKLFEEGEDIEDELGLGPLAL